MVGLYSRTCSKYLKVGTTTEKDIKFQGNSIPHFNPELDYLNMLNSIHMVRFLLTLIHKYTIM